MQRALRFRTEQLTKNVVHASMNLIATTARNLSAHVAQTSGDRAIDELITHAKLYATNHLCVGVLMQHWLLAECFLHTRSHCCESGFIRVAIHGVDIDFNATESLLEQSIERIRDIRKATCTAALSEHHRETKHHITHASLEDSSKRCFTLCSVEQR